MNGNGRRMTALLRRDGDRCHYCGVKTFGDGEVGQAHPDRRTVEHLLAKSGGGNNRLENLVIACFACNNARADTPYETFKRTMDQIMSWWPRDDDGSPQDLAAWRGGCPTRMIG